MSYSPPLGSVVNFQATGVAYSPPSGSAANFMSSFTLSILGGLAVGGGASIESLGTWDLTATSSKLVFSGAASLHTEIGRRLLVNSQLSLTGSAGIVAAASLAATGRVLLSGSASALHGPTLRTSGQLKLHGSPRFKAGPGLSAGFKLRFAGAASFKRGARLTVASRIPFGVLAQSTHAPEIVLQVASGIKLRGRFRVRYRG